MNITDYIDANWNSASGMAVTVRRPSDGRTFTLSVPPHSKWDVWSWSNARLVIRASGRARDGSCPDMIREGWKKVEGTTLVDYLADFEPVV